MFISSDLFMIVNIVVVVAVLLAIFIGYKKGMVYELLSLCSFIVAFLLAYILSPIFSKHFALFETGQDFTSMLMSGFINQVVWFVIIIIAVKLIFGIIIPLSSIISKLPLIGFINRLGGALVGIFNGFVWVLLLSLILSTPLFKNGNEVRENTLIKPVNVISDKVMVGLIDHFNDAKLNEELENQGLNIEDIRDELEDWLYEKGAFNK